MARAALYLDFDNVFGGLMKLDPGAALQFAEDPGSWLRRLSTALTVEGPRRWLVLRCYMNPAGSLPDPAQDQRGSRLYFSRFRPFFTNAGFEVIDCPRLTYTKNAADIRLVLDVVDALATNAQYDEFVIASGDSDMTPLLVRLRSADRRTTIVSPSDAADAFTSIADRLINGQQVLELMQGDQDLETGTSELGHEEQVPKQEFEVPASPVIIDTEGYAGFTHFIQARYDAASEPINLSVLATELVTRWVRRSTRRSGSASAASAGLSATLGWRSCRMSQHFMWHAGRHNAPPGAVEEDPSPRAEPVEQVTGPAQPAQAAS